MFREHTEIANITFQEYTFFSGATFQALTYFVACKFQAGVHFSGARFREEAYFTFTEFHVVTLFNQVEFEQQSKVILDTNDLSGVSFSDCDITRIKFRDKITWGGEDGFTIVEEEWLKQKSRGEEPTIDVSLELVLSVYRNLRENYEYRLRYDEAGKFFIKKMELRRRYRTVRLKNSNRFDIMINNWFRRHFSLTGLYYHFSTYGESIVKYDT